jgi:phosphoglycolate phosphatase
MSIRAVLFDLDGTLLDTLEDLASSMNAVLRRMALPEHGLAHYRQAVGDGVEQLVTRCLPPAARTPDQVERAVSGMRDEYARRWNEKSRPYEGIAELLDALANRGIIMAVLSNKPQDFTRLMVEALLERWTFARVCGARPGEALKPDPAGAVRVARECEIPPRDWLYVGDTDIDMKTAEAAGMHAVGVSWGFRSEDTLWAGGAQAVIAEPLELLPLLRRD